MFERVVHADWSKHPDGRWCASARRTRSGWRADGPWPVGDMAAFVENLVVESRSVPTLAAFDLPVGLPLAYARTTGLPDFRTALDAFGGPGWEMWFEPAAAPGEIGLRRPFYPARSGSATLRHLVDGLGMAVPGDLMRACDRGATGVPAAGCMFWLVGAKTVGKAAVHGWREAIRPALARGAALWPFDGELATLAAAGGLVLAESYPGDAYGQLGLAVRGKNDPAVLLKTADELLAWAGDRRIDLSPELRGAVASGFAAFAPRCGDAFDAAVGLMAALAVADGAPDGAPRSPDVRVWEGWMLGRHTPFGIPP